MSAKKFITISFLIVFGVLFMFQTVNDYRETKQELQEAKTIIKQKYEEAQKEKHQKRQNLHQLKRTLNMDQDTPVDIKSGVSSAAIESGWERLDATGLKGTGEYFVKAEEKHGVNAIFLASLAHHESAGGTSRIARNKNNLFGMGAYDANPYKYAKNFNTKRESILYTARHISENYLDSDGSHYNGNKVSDIAKNYATDPHWDAKVHDVMANMLSDQL